MMTVSEQPTNPLDGFFGDADTDSGVALQRFYSNWEGEAFAGVNTASLRWSETPSSPISFTKTSLLSSDEDVRAFEFQSGDIYRSRWSDGLLDTANELNSRNKFDQAF